MKLIEAARKVFDSCKYAGDDLEVNFDKNEITVYWENLRFDVQPDSLGKALKIIRDAKAMGARFE